MVDDALQQEMDELRREVGRFVLGVLKGDVDGRRALDDVSDQLATRLQTKLTVNLTVADRELLSQVSRKVDDLDRRLNAPDALRSPSTGAAQAGMVTSFASEPQGAAPVGDADPTYAVVVADGRSVRGWPKVEAGASGTQAPRWALIAGGGFVLGVALAALVWLLFLREGPAPVAQAAPEDAASTSAAQLQERWEEVLTVVRTWPAPERTTALRVLCGDSTEPCGPVHVRLQALASNPGAREEAASIIVRARGQARCPGSPAAAALTEFDLDCLLR